MNIQDKVAVITGGASGLGLATAKALAEKGAKLMLLDLNEDNAKAAVAELPHQRHRRRQRQSGNGENRRKIWRDSYSGKLCWNW